MIRRSSKYSMIAGVCAGYGISEKQPIALVRCVMALLLLATFGGAVLLYLAAWILMPAPIPGADESLTAPRELHRKKSNLVIGGVCGAFAEYFSIDATLLRLVAVISVFVFGTGLFFYLFAWAVIPEQKINSILTPNA